MQQAHPEYIMPICLEAFGLANNRINQQIIKTCLNPIPLTDIPDDYVINFEYLKKKELVCSSSSLETFQQENFQVWLMGVCDDPSLLLYFLNTQSLSLYPSTLNIAIQKQLPFEVIEKIFASIKTLPFSSFMETLSILQLFSKDKKQIKWAKEIESFLRAHVAEKLIADSDDLDCQFYFHQQETFFSVVKNEKLTLYFYHLKDSICNSISFNFNQDKNLYEQQNMYSLLQISIFFEVQPEFINQFIPKKCMLNCIHQHSARIHAILKSKIDYFKALNACLTHTAPTSLKAYLVTQDIYNYRFRDLSASFAQTGYEWNQCLTEQDDTLAQKDEYQALWTKVVSAKSIIPTLKQELQAILSSSKSFEEWLFKNTPIVQSMEILKKWKFEFPVIHTDSMNLLSLGICHKQPLKYFQYLIEKLLYKISLEDYFNILACLNCYFSDQSNEKWLLPLWEYIREQGSNIVDISKTHTICSYHFNYEENALLILSEFSSLPSVSHVYINGDKKLQIKKYLVHDVSSLKKIKFEYIFSSEFIIEQVNPEIIFIYLLNIINKDLQLDFIKQLHHLLHCEKYCNAYPKYLETLNQNIRIKNEDKFLELKLDVFLEHHIKRLETTDVKWLEFIEQLNHSFQTKISIKNIPKTYGYTQTELVKYLSEPAEKQHIPGEFIEWLMTQHKPIDSLMKLVSHGYAIECPSKNSFSVICLAILNYIDIEDLKTLIEIHQLRCSSKEFIFCFSFLKLHEKDKTKQEWVKAVKYYLLKNRFLIVSSKLSPNTSGYCELNDKHLIIHEYEQDIYHLISRDETKLKLNKESFYIHYANGQKIIFDSLLKQAIKLKLPIDFIELLVDVEQVKEQPFTLSHHLYFTILKYETQDFEYYQQLIRFVILKFKQFDMNANNLLHFLVELDRADLIEKHYPMLLQFKDQMNTLQQTPITQHLNCSSETFHWLIEMQPQISDSNKVYQYLTNPNYTKHMIRWLKQNLYHLDILFPSGLPLIEELFSKEPNIILLVEMILTDWPDLFLRIHPKDLLFLHINERATLQSITSLLLLFKIDKKDLSILYFMKACEHRNFELAQELFNLDSFLERINDLIYLPFVQEFIVHKNIICQHPEILPHVISLLDKIKDSPFIKPLFKQILKRARISNQF